MPNMVYQCYLCPYNEMKAQATSEKELTDCPICGGPMYVSIHPVPSHFKGDGFTKRSTNESHL